MAALREAQAEHVATQVAVAAAKVPSAVAEVVEREVLMMAGGEVQEMVRMAAMGSRETTAVPAEGVLMEKVGPDLQYRLVMPMEDSI